MWIYKLLHAILGIFYFVVNTLNMAQDDPEEMGNFILALEEPFEDENSESDDVDGENPQLDLAADWNEELVAIPAPQDAGEPPEEAEQSSQPNSQQMDAMVEEATPENTRRSTTWGLRKFTEWCTKRSRQVDLHTIEPEQLNTELRKFYADVKGTKGKSLSPSGLTGVRAALHRTITSPPYSRCLNIIADREFITANQMFVTRCKLYFKAGHVKPRHKPAIASGDMSKLREYFKQHTANPTVLVEYNWFVLCYYFGRRGREGWRDFTTDSFEVKTDDKDRRYVCFTLTEITKNHQGGNRQNEVDYSDQRMYETGSQLCPVAAFELYKQKQHPQIKAFFQTPLMNYSIDQDCWYKKEPMGKNTLGSIMQRISKKAGLSETYSCHSVRASTVTTLGHAGVESRLICGITKHKNEASLKHYVSEMSTDQKHACGQILSDAFDPQINQEGCEPAQPSTDPPNDDGPNAATATVTATHLADGSLAISIPTTIQPTPVTEIYPSNSCSAVAKQSNELKCLQNLLPNCRFDGCTININTMGQAAQNPL